MILWRRLKTAGVAWLGFRRLFARSGGRLRVAEKDFFGAKKVGEA